MYIGIIGVWCVGMYVCTYFNSPEIMNDSYVIQLKLRVAVHLLIAYNHGRP